jgi:hypothetical protein
MKFIKVAQVPPGYPVAPRLPPPPSPGEAQLVTDAEQREVLTSRREVDARTALTRSLKEYLQQLVVVDPGGADLRFKEVFETWAEPETVAVFPSAAIYGAARGAFDASCFTPVQNPAEILPVEDGRYVVKPCEYVQDLVIDIWAADIGVRSMLSAMTEEELSPVLWMYGMRLMVPYYHGVHAVFEPRFADYLESEDAARKRWRRCLITITARIPVVRLVGLPLTIPTVKLTVDDGTEEDVVPAA